MDNIREIIETAIHDGHHEEDDFKRSQIFQNALIAILSIIKLNQDETNS